MKRLFLANANANANAASASASGGSGSGGGSAVVSGGDEHPPKRIAATLNSSSASPVAVAVPYQHSHAHSQPQTQYPRPDALADPNPVTAYQKNAIYRRMLEYKRLHADAADAVLALEDKQAGFAVCMSAFVSCLAQVSEDLSSIRHAEDRDALNAIAQESHFIRAIVAGSQASSGNDSIDSWRLSIQRSISQLASHIKSAERYSPVKEQVDSLQARLHTLTGENAEFKSTITQQSRRIQDLLLELESSKAAWISAERKYDRLKLSAAAPEGGITNSSSSLADPVSQTIPRNNLGMSNGSLGALHGTPTISGEGSATNTELEQLAVGRLRQIEDLTSLKVKLEQEFEAYKLANIHSSGEQSVRQSAYDNLDRELQFHRSENSLLRARVDALSVELEESQADRRKFMDQIEAEEITRRKSLEAEMKKLETDLTRIRAHRDALSDAEKVQKERDAVEVRHREEIMRLSESRKQKIFELESKIERLKLKLLSSDVDQFLIELFKLDSSAPENQNLFSLMKQRLHESEKRVADLEALVKSFEAASNDTRDKQEALLAESKVKRELEEVREELAKIDPDASKKLVDLEQKMDFYQKSESRLIQEIEMLSAAWTDLEAQNQSKVFNLTEKEEQLLKLVAEKTKVEQKCEKLSREKNMVANQVIAFKKQSETQLEQIRRLEDREKLLMSQLQILEKDMAAKTVSSDLHRRKVSELNQKQTELIEKLATMQGKFNEAERTLKEKIQIIADDANTQRRMEERMDALKRKVDAQSKSSNVTDSYLQQENDDLKLLVKCSSCTNNFKSHVLLKCMHTFCKGCLDDLVNSRQRKCPKCGIPFGHADIKPFYL